MSPIPQQIEAFISGSASEYTFPAGLSVEERKLVKITAEKSGLSSRSFGMGSERQIHIFKPASLMTPALEPVKYSVKNTFVDGPLDAWTPAMEQALVTPAHQSMPVGALQQHIAEEESFAATSLALAKVHASPRNSEADTSSTKDSDSELHNTLVNQTIKNTFVHFEIDSEEHIDPRIIQSMPAGTFAENIEEERAEAVNAGSRKGRPSLQDSETDIEESSAMLFPSTPNAENQMSFEEAVPTVQWIPPSAVATESSVTVLPPARWAAPAPSQILLEKESCPAQGPPSVPPQGPPQGLPQASVPPMPPQGPSPAYFMPGTLVVLQGLANQPDFNGLCGVVSAYDADCGRYNVMIEIGPNALKRLVKVKFQNLTPAQPSSVPQPPCCPPIPQSVAANRPPKAALVLDQMV